MIRNRLHRGSSRLALSVAAVALPVGVASAQSFTLQRSNSIDLTGFFFGGGTSTYGVNPISVAFDPSTGAAFVGGYNNSGTFGSIGVVRVDGVLTPAPFTAGLVGTGATFNSSAFRGFQQLAVLNNELFLAYDNNEGINPYIRKIDGTTGDPLWQVDNPAFGARPIAMAIDPRGGATDAGTLGVAGLRFMSQDPFVSGGSAFSLRLSDGAVVYGPGSVVGQGAPGVFITAGQSANATFSNRDIAFDEAGNFLISTGTTHGVATRAGDNSFVQYNVATPGAGSTGVLRKQEGVVNAEGINGVFLPAIGGSGTANFMATSMRVPTGDALSYVQQDGTIQPGLDARDVLLRNLDGSVRANTTSNLTGDEDFLGARYTGQVKDLSVGRDANGNPVLVVLSFADRRMDIYQIEPTFTAAGGDWDNAGSWNLGLIGDGATQNARFSGAGGAVTLNSARSTKLLKFGGTGAYSISGTGTLTLDAPDGKSANIAVLAGNHTVGVPVVAADGTNLRVPIGSTLTLSGGVSGAGVSKLDAGTAVVKNYRVSAVGVRGGVLQVAPHGGNPDDGASRGELQFAQTVPGTYDATLDITNNAVIDPVNTEADIKAAILSGRAGGTWTGTGLTSSAAAANAGNTGVGYATAGDLGLTTYLGQTVAATDVIARYTRLGDANLDGTTGIGDFSLLGANFNLPGGWSKGDFNFDDTVSLGDFSLLAANFNQSAPAASARPGAVPEPTALGVLSLAGLGLVRRRRG